MFQSIFLDQVTSTNDYLKELGRQGKNNIALIAKEQTKGKGRLGRSFSSHRGNGLYMSLLFAPDSAISVPIVAALSVYRVLSKYIPKDLQIKWPNDILVGDKKICGILCESFMQNQTQLVVCGIGVNLHSHFDPEIKNVATSVDEYMDQTPTAELLGAEISMIFSRLLACDQTDVIKEYKLHLKNLNRGIRIIKGSQDIFGTCIDVTRQGELVYIGKDGKRNTVCSGEVSIRDWK